MGFLYEMLQKPFGQLRLEQQIVAGLIVLLGVCLVVFSFRLAIGIFKRGRLHSRRPMVSPVRVSWRDSVGARERDNARCRDISAGGLGVELPDRLKVHTRVHFRVLDSTRLAGTGEVRHCTPIGSRYLIGVRFDSISGSPSGSSLSSAALKGIER
jgi:PilZ domain-containing protein